MTLSDQDRLRCVCGGWLAGCVWLSVCVLRSFGFWTDGTTRQTNSTVNRYDRMVIAPVLTRHIPTKDGSSISLSFPLATSNARRVPPIDLARIEWPTADHQLLEPSPRMPAIPQGGSSIPLGKTKGMDGPIIVCRFAPPPDVVPGQLPPQTFRRRFDVEQSSARFEKAPLAKVEREAPPLTSIQKEPHSVRFEKEALLYKEPNAEEECSSIALPGTKSQMLAELRSAILREEVLTRVIDQFRKYDTNRNGLVSRQEFRHALPLLGLRGYALSDMDVLFEAIDTDRSDNIEYAELHHLLRRGADIDLDSHLKVGAVAFAVRQNGSSNKLRSSARDERFEAMPLRETSIEGIRNALRDERYRVVDAFRCLDKDGNGVVSQREFRAALPLLGFENNRAVADAVFAELDSNGNGVLEYEELNEKLRPAAGVDPKIPNARSRASLSDIRLELAREVNRVIEMFKSVDENSDGSVTKREFRAALPLLGYRGVGRGVIDELFDHFDIDGNGAISFVELRTMLRYELNMAKRREAERSG